jgi:hypothetical protein
LISAGGTQSSEGSDATPASIELNQINEQYFQFLMRISDAEDQAENESACCKQSDEDPIGKIVCKFVRYLRTGKKDRRILLESVPTDSTGRDALWALEPIAYLHAEREPANVPALFKPSGPTTLYLNELFALALAGDGEATSMYLDLYIHSDSEHAEEMDDQLENLFRRHLRLVLRQWDSFKTHRQALVKFSAFLSSDERRSLKSEIAKNKECAALSEACTELKNLLNARTPLRE